jgi:hypothetical protein
MKSILINYIVSKKMAYYFNGAGHFGHSGGTIGMAVL